MSDDYRTAPKWIIPALCLALGLLILGPVNSEQLSVISSHRSLFTGHWPLFTVHWPLAADQGIAYYVRPDGGSPTQCTGRVDAPYPGSGTGQPCSWDHPFRALPPDGTPRIAGGDTLVIAAGSYMMGYCAPG
ncbi:MAG TPA: hypothetical protein DEP84_22260, partial [Chloroflexi bacterium]|nr:hypothetical protein [Chloroflexota bacterium]